MSQSATPQAPESYADRPDSAPAGDVLSTLLRTVHLAGHDVTETAADPPTRWVQRDDMGDPDIGGVLDAVHADPARAWSNAEMAQHAHLSRTTFTERFTRTLGQPPMAYLTELRMELARELLLGSGETAKQVARRTGYKSDAAFNRAFTRHHGRSPGQWRHEHLRNPKE